METIGRRTRVRLEGEEDERSGHETVRKVKLLETNTRLSYCKLQITPKILLTIRKLFANITDNNYNLHNPFDNQGSWSRYGQKFVSDYLTII